MASVQAVRNYVAFHVQQGKKVLSPVHGLMPFQSHVIGSEGLSVAFLLYWRSLRKHPDFQHLQIEGDEFYFGQLLKPDWEFGLCARCDLMIPVPEAGAYQPPACFLCQDTSCLKDQPVASQFPYQRTESPQSLIDRG
jgi:hypothetical protein